MAIIPRGIGRIGKSISSASRAVARNARRAISGIGAPKPAALARGSSFSSERPLISRQPSIASQNSSYARLSSGPTSLRGSVASLEQAPKMAQTMQQRRVPVFKRNPANNFDNPSAGVRGGNERRSMGTKPVAGSRRASTSSLAKSEAPTYTSSKPPTYRSGSVSSIAKSQGGVGEMSSVPKKKWWQHKRLQAAAAGAAYLAPTAIDTIKGFAQQNNAAGAQTVNNYDQRDYSDSSTNNTQYNQYFTNPDAPVRQPTVADSAAPPAPVLPPVTAPTNVVNSTDEEKKKKKTYDFQEVYGFPVGP